VTQPSPTLVELAGVCGVATEFWDWQGRHSPRSAETIQAVLGALEVDASDDPAAMTSLLRLRELSWRRVLPPVVVLRQGSNPVVAAHAPHGVPVEALLTCEDGTRRVLARESRDVPPLLVDGVEIDQSTFVLPADLALGYHTLSAGFGGTTATCPVIVTPEAAPLPPALQHDRAWGLMAQLYSIRSCASWGVGDLADLADLAAWSGGELGAGFVLINPLHAAEPTAPMTPSPYLPVTRRFASPVYIRVEDVPELGSLTPEARTQVDAVAGPARSLNTSDRIDRDASWTAKAAALRLVHAAPRSAARQQAYEDYCGTEGAGLDDFALWSALAEAYGPDFTSWPDGLADPTGPAVHRERVARADAIDFYRWLQWVVNDQLGVAQQSALDAGMGLGIVHDLAVGVHPRGADAWALGDALARGVTVGAPPDQFNQLGQDWSQPPWRPDQLAEQGYAPYRDLLRTVLRHAGGLRVDHVIGLFRLWWVPAGLQASEGTYVSYDHEALIGILALEAQRAGAVVVGEDLGTVEPWVRDHLRERQLLGTSIVWFEKDWDNPTTDADLPLLPEEYRRLCLATVTTHDLPPTWGYLQGAHIDLRQRLGLLTRTVAEERAEAAQEQSDLITAMRGRGLLDPDADDPASVVAALHAWLALTPALLLGVSVPDLVGDLRPMNQPGTENEYPNWRLSLADDSGRVVLLEQLMVSPFARRIADVLAPQAQAGHGPTPIAELVVPDEVGADGWETFCAAVALENAVELEQIGSDDLGWSAERMLAFMQAQEYHRKLAWVAVDAGRVVGVAQYERSRDTTDPTAHVSIAVAADHRRRGIGAELLRTALDVCQTDQVNRLHTGSIHADLSLEPRLPAPSGVGDIPADDPASRFLIAAGFRLGQVEVISALPLPVPEERFAELEAALRPSETYELVSWVGDTPAELIEPYARLRTVMSTAAPAGELTEVEEIWDADRVRDRDARNRSMGLTCITTAARVRATGEPVAFTSLSFDDVPGRAIGQGFTLVLPEHRGHNLGMRIKINNLHRLSEHGYTGRRAITGNAGENEAMLVINRALGYRPAWVAGWWELALDAPTDPG